MPRVSKNAELHKQFSAVRTPKTTTAAIRRGTSNTPVRRDPRPIRESDVLSAVKALLEAKGFRVFRRNTGAFRGEYRSTRTGKVRQRFVRFSEPGMADLWGWTGMRVNASFYGPGNRLLEGTHIEVEIKRLGEKPTKAQEAWLALCEREGCYTLWADSVEMAEEKLKEWGL